MKFSLSTPFKIIIFLFSVILISSISIFYIYFFNPDLKSIFLKIDDQKLTTSPESISAGWKVNNCIHEGYQISYPGDIKPHNIFPGDPSCPSQYGHFGMGAEEPVSVQVNNQQIKDDQFYHLISQNEISINGLKAKFIEFEMFQDGEMRKFFAYEYPGNNKFYLLLFNPYSHDPRLDLDFYKDTQWGQMVDELNRLNIITDESPKTQVVNDSTFHQMAQTFVLTTPVPTPESELEVCIEASMKIFNETLKQITKPSNTSDYNYYEREDYEAADLQYRINENMCYRMYRGENMVDCFKLFPNDNTQEYECNRKILNQ